MTDRSTLQSDIEDREQRSQPSTRPGPDRTSPEHALVLILLLALALTVRLQFVTQPLVDAFSWPEASAAMIADNIQRNGWNVLLPEIAWNGTQSGYGGRELQILTLLAAAANELFGWHDWTGRAVAVAFSLITVLSLHRLAALVWDERHAHVVALVYILLPSAIMIDSSYLPDPAMLALVTAGIWLYVRFFLEGRLGTLVAASVLFALGVLGKPTGLAVSLVPIWLAALLLLEGRIRRALGLIAAMIGVLAVVAAYYGRSELPGSDSLTGILGSGYLWDLGAGTLLKERFYVDDLWRVSVWWLYGPPLLALLLVGLWFLPPRKDHDGPGALHLLPLVWLIGCIVLYLVAAGEITANLWNVHVFNVPFAFIAGHGLIVLIRLGGHSMLSWRAFWRLAMAGVIVVSGSTVPLVSSMKKPVSEDARLLGEALRQMAAPEDLLVAIGPDVGDPAAIFYSRARGWVFPPGGNGSTLSVFGQDGAPAIAQLESLILQRAKWFGYAKNARDDWGRRFVDHHAELIAWLAQNATPVRETDEFAIYRLPEAGGSHEAKSSDE